MKTINVKLSKKHKNMLEKMSSELLISQTSLINLATVSMLKNYEEKGSFILVSILNTD